MLINLVSKDPNVIVILRSIGIHVTTIMMISVVILQPFYIVKFRPDENVIDTFQSVREGGEAGKRSKRVTKSPTVTSSRSLTKKKSVRTDGDITSGAGAGSSAVKPSG